MVIDEEQLYAERLVSLLSAYFDDINLGFWDEKAEFVKAMRSEWDVIIFNRAYDMTMTDVVGVLQEHGAVVPIIQLIGDNENGELGLPQTIDSEFVRTLVVGQDELIVMAVVLLAASARKARQIANLNGILKEAEQRANILINNSKSAVAYIDQGVHIFANEPYLQMFGYDSMEEIIGVPVVDIISGGDNVRAFKQFLRKFDKGDRSEVEFEFESKTTDGKTFASKLQLARASFDGEPVVQMIIQHNENSAEMQKQLAAATRQDGLTGLLNRTGFSEKLDELYNEVLKGTTRGALIFVAIDNIGKLSSQAGILGVDTTVRYLANLLSEVFADGAVGRFGDAMFAIALPDAKDEHVMTLAETARTRFEDALIELGSRTLTATVSVAAVMMDTSTPDVQTLLSRAVDTLRDIASDTDGVGNKTKLFDISEHASDDEAALAEYIGSALAQNRFDLRYQPIYDVQTDNSDLFEVLVSLPLADGGVLGFDKFMAVAQKYKLLDKVDKWVLINASKELARVRKDHPNARLLVGLSEASLIDSALPKMIGKLAQAIGTQSGATYPLAVQFYEQELLDHLAQAKRQFMALSELGCLVGVQGFGVTAKSDEMVEYLHPKLVRLAKSYTKNLGDGANLETVRGLVATAAEHGADVLMPCINDAPMMSQGWSVGARFLQGDYIMPPNKQIVYAETAE